MLRCRSIRRIGARAASTALLASSCRNRSAVPSKSRTPAATARSAAGSAPGIRASSSPGSNERGATDTVSTTLCASGSRRDVRAITESWTVAGSPAPAANTSVT